MAAEFAGENEKFLNAHWGGDVGSTELYFAHFLGAGGAAAFLKARDANGTQAAAHAFPAAAKANRNVFYDTKTGRAKSLDEVYAFFDKKFSIEDAQPLAVADASVPLPPVKPARAERGHNGNSLFAQANTVVKSAAYKNNAIGGYEQMVTSPVEIMLLAQLDPPLKTGFADQDDSFSLYSKARSYNE
jgi:hypothetical protein